MREKKQERRIECEKTKEKKRDIGNDRSNETRKEGQISKEKKQRDAGKETIREKKKIKEGGNDQSLPS